MGDGVLGRTTNFGATTEPALAARLAQLDQAVILIADGANRGTALGVDLTDFTGRKGQRCDLAFTGEPDDKEVIDIYDWKRCKDIKKVNIFDKWAINPNISHIPDTNYWHYAFQLNGYKWILEKNYDKIIRDMYLVCLHPDNFNKSYKLIKIPDLQKEITLLFQERINNIN